MKFDIPGTQVIGVRQETTRKGGSFWKIQLTLGHPEKGNEPSTFNYPEAEKARMFIGVPVDVRVEITDKGYFNFIDVAPAGQLPPLAIPAGTQVVQSQVVQGVPAGQSNNDFSKPMRPEDVARVTSLSVFETAFLSVSNLYVGAGPEALEQMKAEALALAVELYTKAMGGAAQPPAQTQAQVVYTPQAALPPAPAAPLTPEQLAAQINGQAGQPVLQPGTAIAAPAVGAPSWGA